MSKTHYITIGNACNASNGKIRQQSGTLMSRCVTVTVGNGDPKSVTVTETQKR